MLRVGVRMSTAREDVGCSPRIEVVRNLHVLHHIVQGFALFHIESIAFCLFVVPVVDHCGLSETELLSECG